MMQLFSACVSIAEKKTFQFLAPQSTFKTFSSTYPYLKNSTILMINPNNPFNPQQSGLYNALSAHASLLSLNEGIHLINLNFTTESSAITESKLGKGTITSFPVAMSEISRLKEKLNELQKKLAQQKQSLNAIILYLVGAPFEYLISQFAKEAGIPVIYQHSTDLSAEYIPRTMFPSDSKHVVVNKGSMEVLQRTGYQTNRILPPMDGKYQTKDNQKEVDKIKNNLLSSYPIRNNSFTIFAPSRLSKLKGVFDLVKTAKQLNTSTSDFQILFIYNDNYLEVKNQLMAEAESSGVADRILFIKDESPLHMKALYQLCDVAVLPTYSEASGLVIQEAASQGIPTVAYATGGVPEVILDGVTGILVKQGDINHFAAQLKKLHSEKELLKAMKEKAFVYASKTFSLEERFHEFSSYLNEILEQNNANLISFNNNQDFKASA